jgi:hypothetical protein
MQRSTRERERERERDREIERGESGTQGRADAMKTVKRAV